MAMKKIDSFFFEEYELINLPTIMSEHVMSESLTALYNEHKFLCDNIKELEVQLEFARKAREQSRTRIINREYIDNNICSAWSWIAWKRRILKHGVLDDDKLSLANRNIIAILDTLNTCDCCARHMRDRPRSVDDKELYISNKPLRPVKEVQKDLALCDCSCRNVARMICRDLLK